MVIKKELDSSKVLENIQQPEVNTGLCVDFTSAKSFCIYISSYFANKLFSFSFENFNTVLDNQDIPVQFL